MKVYREERKFQPVTIIIESQEELDYLLAVLNTSQNRVQVGWEGLQRAEGIPERKLNMRFQMPFYEAILDMYEEKK